MSRRLFTVCCLRASQMTANTTVQGEGKVRYHLTPAEPTAITPRGTTPSPLGTLNLSDPLVRSWCCTGSGGLNRVIDYISVECVQQRQSLSTSLFRVPEAHSPTSPRPPFRHMKTSVHLNSTTIKMISTFQSCIEERRRESYTTQNILKKQYSNEKMKIGVL